ncbi:MAG: glycosyltransferase family 4 protein [Bdellovibrio sp.]
MRIAFISTIPAVPPTSGNRSRILGLVHALRALNHEVFFVYMPSRLHEAPDVREHEMEFGTERFLKLPHGLISRPSFLLKRLAWKVRRKIAGLFGGGAPAFYFGLDELFPDDARFHLQALQAEHKFDVVICEYLFHSAALEAFPAGVLKILDTHDSFSDRHKLFSRNNYWFSVPPSEQARGFRRADVVLAIQEAEGDLFRRQIGGPRPPVAVVSHLLDVSAPVKDFSPADGLFLGSGNTANIAAVAYFMDAVLPSIRRRLPGFRLVLAGSICDKVPDAEGVLKLGIVEKLADAYARAPLSLNPMQAGTGIAIKLLDALAAGVPTVTTRTGARGLGEAYGNGVVVVPDDDAEAFADAVVALSSSEAARREKGDAAYRDALAWNATQISVLRSILDGT